MRVARSIKEFQDERRRMSGTVGLVPTMGYLHRGHESLIEAARRDNDEVVTWIFVNPKQFAANEDLSTYPRNEKGDLETCRKHNVSVVLIPGPEDMYPKGFGTFVDPAVGSADYNKNSEGASRPSFFRGVATVLVKMFNIVQPDRAYFGQKDAQQCVVARTIVRDLNMPLKIVVVPTVREDDGLALSSRNAYLGPEEREQALILYRALSEAARSYESGVRDAEELRQIMRSVADSEPAFRLQYVSVSDADAMQECRGQIEDVIIALAGW
eukprot:CAMPEP_0198732726 /NCGR_PEP_ID=MMETSP1475-20131203/38754_1 /TAXON_ID= ORGANISM="Unidentified sp., Strain CCMP1999" /NCGR_SAMPLE_ID=MMETSP1475 /ASSEMBLY_ACC=CAM_ASM_001111 /LENGTH=268 /DNA_ID=CAMNT_0044495883 /DNA_START=134 /DNA_END=937 /DNA_ORIENTATION=+